MIYKELTYKIISCCMKVHNTLGNGFQEVLIKEVKANIFDILILYVDFIEYFRHIQHIRRNF